MGGGGRGIIKFLIGLFTGAGVGLLVIEYFAHGNPDFWRTQGPPPQGVPMGVGVACLVSAVVWFLLFFGFGKGGPPHR